jgi:hypothetical protein
MKCLNLVLLAGLAASKPTNEPESKPVDRQLAQPSAIINVQNQYKQCLVVDEEFVVWGPCDAALQFQSPSNPTQPSQLRTADGKACLSLIPYGPTKFPDFRMLPCKDGKKRTYKLNPWPLPVFLFSPQLFFS